MIGPRLIAVIAAGGLLGAACPRPDVFSGFDGAVIDSNVWQPVGLLERDAIRASEPGHASRFAVVWADPDELSPECAGVPNCVIQRSERRLRDQPPFGEGRWYGFSFRMDGGFASTGTVRWVIGQWKESGSGASPFLSQRYDNGVFHVVSIYDDCRKTIAKAPGDPEARGRRREEFFALDEKRHLRGVFDAGTPRAGEPCESDVTLDPSPPPDLPSPRDGWVHMAYFVKGGLNGDGVVSVFAGGRHYVTARGSMGDPVVTGPRAEQFKFGIYRDKLPYTSSMLFDSFRRGATREAVDPTLCGD